MRQFTYPMKLTPDKRDGGYVVTCRDLPEAITQGESIEDALLEATGDDPVLNACALAYLSDDLPTDAVVARHPDRPPRDASERTFWSASLDHAIWFHRPMAAEQWHLHDFTTHGYLSSRGLAIGHILTAGGTLNYTENDPPSVIDGAMTVTDTDSLTRSDSASR